MSYRTESVGGRGSLRGDGALPGGGGWLEAWNKGAGAWGGSLRAWGLERAGGLRWGGEGWTVRGPDGRSLGRSFVRTFGRTDGNSPRCSVGHCLLLPKRKATSTEDVLTSYLLLRLRRF